MGMTICSGVSYSNGAYRLITPNGDTLMTSINGKVLEEVLSLTGFFS